MTGFLEIEASHSESFDNEEAGGLLNSSPKHQSSKARRNLPGTKGRGILTQLAVIAVLVVLVLFLRPSVVAPSDSQSVSSRDNKDTTSIDKDTTTTTTTTTPTAHADTTATSAATTTLNTKPSRNKKRLVKYDCPAVSYKPVADQAEWYDEKSRKIAANVTEFLTVFRNTEFDNWGHTYAEVKHGMLHWKSQQFRGLKDGATIYESACGLGLNMYMTLEILESDYGLKNVQIYGNEYVPESVDIAREVWKDGRVLPAQATQGQICAGDSRDLHYVPTASFDLVYSGYITPDMDPLLLNGTTDENYVRLTELCEAKDGPQVHLAEKAQRAQEDWYGKWVGEMARIAKPGAPIIVEQVSYPFCGAFYDWGGVGQGYWKRAARRYEWDVDLESIVFEDDKIFRKRYHVKMVKNA